MTERRSKTKGGKEEYRKKHDNENGIKGRRPAERKRGKRQTFSVHLNNVNVIK